MKNLAQKSSKRFFKVATLRVVTLMLFVVVFGAGAALAQTADDALYRVIAVPQGQRNNFTNIYAPNGTVFLRANTVATGAFIGKQVEIGQWVELTLKSAFQRESCIKAVVTE